MSDPKKPEPPQEPGKSRRPTFAEESRERWAPDHADMKEAGDDGPHTTKPTDVPRTAHDGDPRPGPRE